MAGKFRVSTIEGCCKVWFDRVTIYVNLQFVTFRYRLQPWETLLIAGLIIIQLHSAYSCYEMCSRYLHQLITITLFPCCSLCNQGAQVTDDTFTGRITIATCPGSPLKTSRNVRTRRGRVASRRLDTPSRGQRVPRVNHLTRPSTGCGGWRDVVGTALYVILRCS